jgi:PBP1b-binding outer membrane lipoprotein LpoB
MKQLAFLIFILFLFSACSSLDSDAKKAAELNKQSIEYAKNADLKKAEELYKESQEIVNSYIGSDEYDEFNKAYHQYMEGTEKP